MLLVCLSSLVLDIILLQSSFECHLWTTLPQGKFGKAGEEAVTHMQLLEGELEKARSMLIALQLLTANGWSFYLILLDL